MAVDDDSLSLWPTLHDGRLEEISSSRDDQSLVFRIDLPHLRKFHQLPAETQFEIRCLGAVWVRIGEGVPWAGIAFGVAEDWTAESAPDWVADWQGKSASWEQFEQSLAAQAWGPAWVFEAWLEKIPHGPIPNAQQMLRLGLQVNEEFWPGLCVCFSQLEIATQDGRAWTLTEFLDLGVDYWEDFAERSQAVRQASIPR
jgi:hypothetical protein